MAKISMKKIEEIEKSAKKDRVMKTLDSEVWDKVDFIKESIGADELIEAMIRAMDTDEANGILDYITTTMELEEETYKSMSISDMVKALKKSGYVVFKAEDEVKEEEPSPEESSEDKKEEEHKDESEADEDETEVEINVDKRAKKSVKEILNAKQFVRKAEDKGPDAEEVETEAIGSENAVEVPETPEPSDNVEDVETGVPDEVPEEDSEKNQDAGKQVNNDVEALLSDAFDNGDTDIAGAEIDELIGKAQKKSEMRTGIEAIPFVGSDQPYANNYRTVQMGGDKLDVMSQFRQEAMDVQKRARASRAELGGHGKGMNPTKRSKKF